MGNRCLSVEEIGEYPRVKRDTIYRWIQEKNMPAQKIGRKWKFKKKDVDTWVKAGGATG